MAHDLRVLGSFNPLLFYSLHVFLPLPIWLGVVDWLISQSQLWDGATCFLKIGHLRCAENHTRGKQPCCAGRLLLHTVVNYTMQLALQDKISCLAKPELCRVVQPLAHFCLFACLSVCLRFIFVVVCFGGFCLLLFVCLFVCVCVCVCVCLFLFVCLFCFVLFCFLFFCFFASSS